MAVVEQAIVCLVQPSSDGPTGVGIEVGTQPECAVVELEERAGLLETDVGLPRCGGVAGGQRRLGLGVRVGVGVGQRISRAARVHAVGRDVAPVGINVGERVLRQDSLQLRHSHHDGVVARLFVGPRRRVPRNGRHLIERELASAKGCHRLRQLIDTLSNGDQRLGSAVRDAAPPAEPGRH